MTLNSRDKLNEYRNRFEALERELDERKSYSAYKSSIETTKKELEKSEVLYKEAEELKRIKECESSNIFSSDEQVAVNTYVSFTDGLPYDYALELERQRTELEEERLKFLQEKVNRQIEENIRLKERLAYRYYHSVAPYYYGVPSPNVKQKIDDIQEDSVERKVSVTSEKTMNDMMSVSQDSVVFDGNARLTFLEAYALLSPTQKHFCDGLLSYAHKQSGEEERDSKYHVCVGCGFNQVIKIMIKNNIVVVSARMEDHTLRNLRLSDTDTPIKTRETTVKVVDNGAYETAKRLIDLRIEQIADSIAEKKQMRKEKRKVAMAAKK